MFGVLSVVSKRFRAVGLIYQQSVEGDSRDPENKKTRSRREEIPRVKSDGGSRNGPKVEGYGGLLRCGNNAPDGLDYEPVIRSGHCLAGQEGFEPSTIRLTAERTTAVLLTLK